MTKRAHRIEYKCNENFERLKFHPKPKSAKGAWIECETCKRPFYVCPSRLRHNEKKGTVIRYCSLACRPYSREFNPFWRKHHTEEAISKMKAHPGRPKFVSGFVTDDPNNDGHDVQNPNLTRFGPQFRGKNIQWWREFLMRTVGHCEVCGYDATPGILVVHHIDRNRRHNHRDNLLLLCPNCHALDHYEAKDGPFRGVNCFGALARQKRWEQISKI